VIANCPACGTHYKHESLASSMRGRCGRCDTTIDLSRLRPYRIVGPHAEATVVPESPMLVTAPSEPEPATGFDLRPAPIRATSPVSPDSWETDDPLPSIPEMAGRDPYEASVPPVTEADILESVAHEPQAEPAPSDPARRPEGRGTTWVLWLAAGAIAGTGTSWTLGGTTLMGISSGAIVGALAGWGWLRWTSPR